MYIDSSGKFQQLIEVYPISHVLSLLIWSISSVLGKTWRTTVKSTASVDLFSPQTAYIYCFWHSRLLTVSYVSRNSGKTAVVSQSRDGQLAAQVAKRWKHEIIFGSSSRGGSSALRQCLRVLRKGGSIGITPDGPRGPAEIVKPGVAQISLKSGVPVVIINVKATSAWHLKSWDSFMIPKPFARVSLQLSDPIEPGSFFSEKDPEKSMTREIQGRFCV